MTKPAAMYPINADGSFLHRRHAIMCCYRLHFLQRWYWAIWGVGSRIKTFVYVRWYLWRLRG